MVAWLVFWLALTFILVLLFRFWPTGSAVVSLLDKWQTLIGAALGGSIGLLAALIVARDARRREERSSAALLIGDLAKLMVVGKILEQKAEQEQVSQDAFAQWRTFKLMNTRPKLSLLFEQSMSRVLVINTFLSAHLWLLNDIYSGVLEHLDTLEEANDIKNRTGEDVLTPEQVDSHVRSVDSGFSKACEHARCAEALLEKLVMRWTAPFSRLGLSLGVLSYDQDCVSLRETGEVAVRQRGSATKEKAG